MSDINPSTAKSQVFRGSAIIFVGFVLQFFLIFIAEIILSRYLQPERFGILQVARSLVVVFSAISLLGIPTLVSRYISVYFQEGNLPRLRGLLLAGFILTSLTGAVSGYFLFHLSDWFSSEIYIRQEMGVVVGGLAFGVIFVNWKNYASAVFSGVKKPSYRIILINIVEPILMVAMVVYAATAMMELDRLVYLLLIGYILVGVAGMYLVLRLYPRIRKNEKAIDWNFEGVIGFSLPLMLTGVFSLMVENMDKLMLGWLGDVRDVGLYSVAFFLTKMVGSALGSFVFMYLPVAVGLYSGGKRDELRALSVSVARWSLVIAFPVTLSLVVYPQEILVMCFGDSYASADDALLILGLGYLFHAATGMTGMNLVVCGRTDLQLLCKTVVFLVNAVLNYYLIPVLGMTGAALATAVALFLSNILNLYLVHQVAGLLPFDRHYMRVLISLILVAFVATVISWFFYEGVAVFVQALIFVLVWPVIAWRFKLVTINEKRGFMKLVFGNRAL